uniref:PPM-type phosphatase domain-containing protein n=1 Tax=Angiostrongylus cantonensis TaxID=6313 RepID=A0A158P953_ANGCA
MLACHPLRFCAGHSSRAAGLFCGLLDSSQIFVTDVMLSRQLLLEWRRAIHNLRWNADAHLRAHERSVSIDQDCIVRVDTCQLAANNPIEDFYSAAKCLSSDAFLFGVFDGHGGPACSRHVSTSLFPYICASVLQKHETRTIPLENRLEWIFGSADPHLPNLFMLVNWIVLAFKHGEHSCLSQNFQSEQGSPYRYISIQLSCFTCFLFEAVVQQLSKLFNQVLLVSNCVSKILQRIICSVELPIVDFIVREALKFAFETCDEDLCRAALPDSKGHFDKLAVMTAASGSCATLAHVRGRNLHVANVGDGAAVLGVVHANGSVTARHLSHAHCVDNADEVQRIRSSHPNSETQLLRGGRLLGELYPLRAFGDVRFKWPLDLQKVVLEPMGNPAPPNLLTPPYLTVSPEVLYHKLTPNDRFLVLATDGLWEWLDPDTVVRLVHDHALGTMTLQPYQPKEGTTLKQVLIELHQRKIGEQSRKKPIDENCATHIIRNALGGVTGGQSKQYERLIDILQIAPGRARNYRDDISVIVIHFNEDYLALKEDSFSSDGIETQAV